MSDGTIRKISCSGKDKNTTYVIEGIHPLGAENGYNPLDRIKTLVSQLKESDEILKDFITTEVCSATWTEEMYSTIESVLKEHGTEG